MNRQTMIDEIVKDTIREVNIDPTDRLNELDDKAIEKEYKFLNSLKGWD